MAFNIFATATSDIPLANLDANFTLIGAAAAVSTLYPTATTSITYGTAGTTHNFSGSGVAVTGTLSSTTGANFATSSGNVGIGGSTITDNHLLNVQGSTASNNIGIILNKTNTTAQIWGITNTGPLTFYNYTASSEAMRITSTGNVGIGTTSPSYLLHVNTDSAGKPGVGGLWTVVSDERIKANIVPANLDRCYEIVKSVPLKHFGFASGVYTDDQIQDKHNLGWIAQDVQKVFKNAVCVKPFTLAIGDVIEDCLDLNSGQMIAALYGCVQALMAKVEALEAK